MYGRLYTNYETQIHSVDTFVDPLENSVYTEGGEVIVPASGETAEDISIASVVEKPGIILGGDLNIITPSAVVNPVFLALELSYGKPHFDLAKRAQGKSVVHIHNEDIANVFFDRPCIAEQRRIGEFFDRLDTLITLHQRKLELLRNIKKSMLDKMFPKGGSLYPEIRFAGFTDPWEQRKLGELFEESDERASDREILSVSVANGIYPASESDRETNPGASLANYKIVHSGDVVYNSMRMWQGAVDASRYGGIVSPAYVVARPNSEVYARFFARLLRQPMLLKQYQQVSQGNSKDTQVLKFDDFASIGISMPASENEQRRIGAFFDRLDSLITLHQRKLELLRNIKKSMLDKMFV